MISSKFVGINTNMYIENFHKQIKDRYFTRMSIDRMDKSVTLILQYIKDRSRERIVSLLRGKHTCKDAAINSNHRLSEKLSFFYQYLTKMKLMHGTLYHLKIVEFSILSVKFIKRLVAHYYVAYAKCVFISSFAIVNLVLFKEKCVNIFI
jgi:hypothetical protein